MAEKGLSGMTKEEISALSEKIGGAAFALLVSIPFVGPQLLETAGKAAEMADAASVSLGWGAAGRIGMESAGAATAAVLIVASNALVAKAAAALRARRKGPVADAASRGCLFEMKGTDGVVRFRLDAKECVPLTHEEFLDARDHSPSAVVVSLGDGLAMVDRFDHGRPESVPRLGGGMLPAHAEYRLDCASLVSGAPSSAKSFDPSDPDAKASADPRGWLESVAKAVDLRAPFRVGHAFEGWPCDAAAAAKKIQERGLSAMVSKVKDKAQADAETKAAKPDAAVLGG